LLYQSFVPRFGDYFYPMPISPYDPQERKIPGNPLDILSFIALCTISALVISYRRKER
jgi:hypothetical protein